MLIDDVKIMVKAGKGGDGAVAFNKIRMALGPTGADGGKGGSIYFEGISNLSKLNQFRYKKVVVAEDGKNGKGQFNDGRDAPDLVLKVPVGTVVHNLTANESQEIVGVGQRLLVAQGGRGGKGNFKFRSSTNTSPRQFQQGSMGQEFELRLELKLIADIGLIGLPNSGKSSLLNELTNAKSKVANYAFTTLDPNLGAYYEFILADIPGLIEGASTGKGLGIKFLRHVERTKILFHLISAESLNLAKDYQVIKDELAAYNPKLLLKPEYVFLSKSDLLEKEEINKKLKELKNVNKQAMAISIIDENSLKSIKKILNQLITDRMSDIS